MTMRKRPFRACYGHDDCDDRATFREQTLWSLHLRAHGDVHDVRDLPCLFFTQLTLSSTYN
jgi:hypothetical protein